jgi:uncharacterized membrane protein
MSNPSEQRVPQKLSVRFRLILSALAAGCVALFLPHEFHWATRFLCVWDAGMICFLGLTLRLMFRATPEKMQRYAKQEDQGRVSILTLVTAAACISIFAITFILGDTSKDSYLMVLHLSLSIVTIVGSWLLVHTIFALHYARIYYQEYQTLAKSEAEGLDFPGEHVPDYWDFLYFSFVIGMTSQVSDVDITSRTMRRLGLIHGILSFFFNTTIVAMTINIVAGLIQK